MHLAVKSVEQIETTRPVRFLLIKGARTDIRDNKGRLPRDLIGEVKSAELTKELKRMLVSAFPYLMLILYRTSKEVFKF